MTKQIITVIGGTGAQGGGVVEGLLASGQFKVRVVSHNPASKSAETLEKRGVEVVKGDLLEPSSLRAAFEGAYGAFVVTNFWDPTQMPRETEIGIAAVQEARAAGVQHLIWSTLPNAENLSGGRLKLPHFTGKARVDAAVEAAGFPRHTFVQAPFYFQNFLGLLAPQPLPNGGRGWAVPMDPTARVIHAGDITDLGRAVAAAFAAGDKQLSRRVWRPVLVERLRQHAERAGPRPSGAAGARRYLRHVFPGGGRDPGDVSVLRAVHVLRTKKRVADCRSERVVPGRIHRLFGLGTAQPRACVREKLTP